MLNAHYGLFLNSLERLSGVAGLVVRAADFHAERIRWERHDLFR